MILDRIAPQPPKLLIFRYFLLLALVLSCADNSSKKETEPQQEEETELAEEDSKGIKNILFFGDSLTAGYGLDDNSDAYPAIVQSKIDKAGLGYNVINSGVSGETTAGGLSRINWVLKQEVDIFVLELGANDGLRGISLDESRENLQSIIDAVNGKYPDATIILAGMQLPPNLGQAYTSEFRSMFSELAEENKIELIPFLLENVGGIPELNLPDGIHPNVEGQKIVAENVWEVLEPLLKQ